MRSTKVCTIPVVVALWTMACGAGAPVGPVVHEHHAVERGTATDARVEAGAGDTTIHLPAGVGISARTSGIIGDSNVSGLEKRDGRWINPRADTSPVTIDLQVQHAIGDLKLSAE